MKEQQYDYYRRRNHLPALPMLRDREIITPMRYNSDIKNSLFAATRVKQIQLDLLLNDF